MFGKLRHGDATQVWKALKRHARAGAQETLQLPDGGLQIVEKPQRGIQAVFADC